jgi:hypothetical protein
MEYNTSTTLVIVYMKVHTDTKLVRDFVPLTPFFWTLPITINWLDYHHHKHETEVGGQGQ